MTNQTSISESTFWKTIEGMNFNENDYDGAGEWLVSESGLTIDEMAVVERMACEKVGELYDRLKSIYCPSDDCFSDLLWQILANGKEAFENATVESAQEMFDNDAYEESFSYAFHQFLDLQENIEVENAE
jgi:hypothetical protein